MLYPRKAVMETSKPIITSSEPGMVRAGQVKRAENPS
jgi:hypothetical protein